MPSSYFSPQKRGSALELFSNLITESFALVPEWPDFSFKLEISQRKALKYNQIQISKETSPTQGKELRLQILVFA